MATPNNSEESDGSIENDPPGQTQDDSECVELSDVFATLDSEEGGPQDPVSTPTDLKQIGPYQIQSKIAEGGMGAVYLAIQQHPIRRRVALKVIKAGKDSSQIISRFEAERQALAMMEHQNIAKILDAGRADDGSPYFAMELVDGIPITTYCDENKLSIRARLELFVPICQAVQHAHQKGIIHRDLKPSNVLVATLDGQAVPKVIDFGLAKATEHQSLLSDKTMFTEFGQVVGTLQYMSPEQAGVDAQDIDTRTDVYSLGVMLYELLTGSTPLERKALGQNALLKILEIIRHEEPPRPSIRLSDSADSLDSVSTQRKIPPTRLKQILRGELDWIVMKSIEKNRGRRYATPNEFAADVERFLNDDAVQARPPSKSYRVQKFVRKNRVLVAASSAVLIALVAGLVAASYGLVAASRSAKRERIANQAAQTQRDKADEKAALALTEAADQAVLSEFMLDVFGAGDPLFGGFVSQFGTGIGKTSTVNELVSKATDKAMEEGSGLSGKPLIKARMLDRLGDVQMAIGNLEKARELQFEASRLLRSAGITEGIDLAKNLSALAVLHYLYGEMDECRQCLERSAEIREFEIGVLPNSRQELRDLQQTRILLGIYWSEFQNFDEAESNFQLVMNSDRNAAPESPLQIALAKLMFAATRGYRLEVDNENSVYVFPFALDALGELLKPEFNESLGQPFRLGIQASLFSQMNLKKKAYTDFQQMHEDLVEAFGPEHFMTMLSRFFVIVFEKNSLKQLDKAAEGYDELIALVDRKLGRSHPRFAMILAQYGTMRFRQWRDSDEKDSVLLEQARELLQESLEIRLSVLGDSHRQVAGSRYWLGRVLRAQKEYAGARENFRECLRIRRGLYENDHETVQRTRWYLCLVLEKEEKLNEAKSLAEELVELQRNKAVEKDGQARLGSFELVLGRLMIKVAVDEEDKVKALAILTGARDKMLTDKDRYPTSLAEVESLLDEN